MLAALDMHLGPTPEIVILGDDNADTATVLAELRHRFIPNKVVAFRPSPADWPASTTSPALAGLFEGKGLQPPSPIVFICENFACQAPITGKTAAINALERLTNAAKH
jgi:uncharacterized protein YyaL (SSP411 family)